MSKPSRIGSTFAERKAAREGAEYEAPAPVETGNSTFAERAGKTAPETESEAKQVDDKAAENKAVKSAASKSRKS